MLGAHDLWQSALFFSNFSVLIILNQDDSIFSNLYVNFFQGSIAVLEVQVFGSVMALMRTSEAPDASFMVQWYVQNRLAGKSWFKYILRPRQYDFSNVES